MLKLKSDFPLNTILKCLYGVYALSFSSTVKNELCRMNIHEKCCMLSELAAVIRIGGSVKLTNKVDINIKVATENAALARKVFSTIKNIYNINPEVTIRRSNKLKKHILYILVITSSTGAKQMLESMAIRCTSDKEECSIDYLPYTGRPVKSNCCKKAYLRGAFLAGGSISDPEKIYHLEITAHSMKLANELCGFINKFKLNARVIKRKGNYIVYLKEGESIVDFLNVIGAHTALLELENVRIFKEMRNNVNRIVNCETANLEKTINASWRQVENIRYIRDNMGFESLPENLRQIAEMRLEYSDANLKELGEMLSPTLGKSGVNHRLRKLDKIAEDIRNLKGEF